MENLGSVKPLTQMKNKNCQHFKQEYVETYPYLKKSTSGEYDTFFCICKIDKVQRDKWLCVTGEDHKTQAKCVFLAGE